VHHRAVALPIQQLKRGAFACGDRHALTAELDDVDLMIIHELQGDGRMTNV
jgi:hypothetical protein